MSSPSGPDFRDRSWIRKFADSFRGIGIAIRDENSFRVHLPCAVGVVVLGLTLNLSATKWCLLTLCITTVLAAELFNSALEILARAVDQQENSLLRDALDISSGAVVVVSVGAAVCGALILMTEFNG